MAPTLPNGVTFRSMMQDDVPTVLEIIRQHDEDDYEEAKAAYQYGVDGQFVLTLHQQVIGATGAEEDDETDRTWWLSWTYLEESHQGTGLGAVMLATMVEQLREWNARKLFVATSDYVDLDRGQIYQDAMEAYQRLGFTEEVRHLNYYDRNEAQIILGYRLDPPPTNHRLPEPLQEAGIVLGYAEIPETEDAYFVEWGFDADSGSDSEDMEQLFADVKSDGARLLFASVPTTASRFIGLLQASGFMEDGRLQDFHEDGIDDIHFRYDI